MNLTVDCPHCADVGEVAAPRRPSLPQLLVCSACGGLCLQIPTGEIALSRVANAPEYFDDDLPFVEVLWCVERPPTQTQLPLHRSA